MRVLALVFMLMGFAELALGQMSATSTVTQGQKRTVPMTVSKWTSSAQLSYSKNQDYYSDAFTSLGLGVGYKIKPNWMSYLEAGYSTPISNNPEKTERYGISDVDLGLNVGQIYKNKYNFTVGATTSLTLPTSTISKNSSLNAGWSGGLTTSTPLQYGFNVSSSHILFANWYRYETADEAGYSYNYPFGYSNSIALRWSKKSFYVSGSFGLTYLKDFADTEINIQSTRAAIGYSLTKIVSAEIYGRWKDRVLTNNSVFDEDNTYMGFLLTVAL